LREFLAAVMLLLGCGSAALRAQGNYEVQVYGSELTPKGVTMVELHSNFTAKGFKGSDGLYATYHAQHETVEITHGFNEWFECGFYVFMTIQPGGNFMWVGDHIRPRITVPERYKLPVGISLSQEIGYQRPGFDPNTWTWELRPIVDKQLGKLYMALNPVFDRSLHGPDQDKGWGFSPNVKFSYDVVKRVAAGVEYYGAYGPWKSWDPVPQQSHMIVPALDIDFGKRWEFNFGVGVGVTQATDHLLIKCILGYRLGRLKG